MKKALITGIIGLQKLMCFRVTHQKHIKKLSWDPTISFEKLVKETVDSDLLRYSKVIS